MLSSYFYLFVNLLYKDKKNLQMLCLRTKCKKKKKRKNIEKLAPFFPQAFRYSQIAFGCQGTLLEC